MSLAEFLGEAVGGAAGRRPRREMMVKRPGPWAGPEFRLRPALLHWTRCDSGTSDPLHT